MRCFFIGHKDAPSSLLPLLEEQIEHLIINENIKEFLVGQYGAFDRMAAAVISKMKLRYPFISLTILAAYPPAKRALNIQVPYDSILYPWGLEKVPSRVAIIRANRYAIDHSDYLVIYAWQTGSNSLKYLEYAKRKKGLHILPLPRQK